MREEQQQGGTVVEQGPCPECGSSDARTLYDNGGGRFSTYCFSCTHAEPYTDSKGHPTTKRNQTTEDYNMDETGGYPDVPDEYDSAPPSNTRQPTTAQIMALPQVPVRGLTLATVQAFKVRTALSESDGKTPTEVFSPESRGGAFADAWEQRIIEPKGFYGIGDRKGSLDLWGRYLTKGSSKDRIIITEGRLDAMSLYQLYHAELQGSSRVDFVSLTRGAQSVEKDIAGNLEWLEGYSEIILCLDNDAPGQDATAKALKIIPTALVLDLPCKDANDWLHTLVGDSVASKAAFWHIAKGGTFQRQTKSLGVAELLEEAMNPPPPGVDTPWPTFNRLFLGLRPHTIGIVGAAPKIGKTFFSYQLTQGLLEQGHRVGILDLEANPVTTLKRVASLGAGVNFLHPDNAEKAEELKEAAMKYEGKISFYDRAGSREWDAVKQFIVEEHIVNGVCFFALDPLTALISQFSTSEANERLNSIMSDMADLVSVYPISIICYSHVNPKAKGSTPHEKNGAVLSSEFTGSRAMERWSHWGIGLRRDRSPECPDEWKNVLTADILYDRTFGSSGAFYMQYDPDTTQLRETEKPADAEEEAPKRRQIGSKKKVVDSGDLPY